MRLRWILCLLLAIGTMGAKGTSEETLRHKKGGTRAVDRSWPAPQTLRRDLPEAEPNDNCALPDSISPFEDDIQAAIEPAADEDWYPFEGTAGQCITLGTRPLNASITDTQLFVYRADDCEDTANWIGFDDDSGFGLFSQLTDFELPITGSYFVRIRHFSRNITGEYELFATTGTCPSPPAGDSCAEPVVAQCDTVLTASTLGASNQLDDEPEELCLEFGGSGPELFFEVCVPHAHRLEARVQPSTSWDPSLWVVTDCADRTTCLASADGGTLGDPELVRWHNKTGEEVCVFVVTDSWTASAAGEFTLEVSCQLEVGVREANWGAVKGRFGRGPRD